MRGFGKQAASELDGLFIGGIGHFVNEAFGDKTVKRVPDRTPKADRNRMFVLYPINPLIGDLVGLISQHPQPRNYPPRWA